MEAILVSGFVGVVVGAVGTYYAIREAYPEVTTAIKTAVQSAEKKVVDAAVKAING